MQSTRTLGPCPSCLSSSAGKKRKKEKRPHTDSVRMKWAAGDGEGRDQTGGGSFVLSESTHLLYVFQTRPAAASKGHCPRVQTKHGTQFSTKAMERDSLRDIY